MTSHADQSYERGPNAAHGHDNHEQHGGVGIYLAVAVALVFLTACSYWTYTPFWPFGHGPDSEIWKIEEHFLALINDCMKLLKPQPLLFLVNGYSAGYSPIAYENALLPLVAAYGGSIEIGELAIEEAKSARLLPAGIFARWSADK